MLAIENYSVQATRREADQQRAEAVKQRAEAVQQRAEAVQQRAEAELRLKNAVKSLLDKGNSIKDVAEMMDVSEEYITNLLPELAPA